jgi:hypothetical protein
MLGPVDVQTYGRKPASSKSVELCNQLGLTRCRCRAAGDQCRPAATAADTAAMKADNAGHVRTPVEYRPSAQTATDGPGRYAYSYGSDAPRHGRDPCPKMPTPATHSSERRSANGFANQRCGTGETTRDVGDGQRSDSLVSETRRDAGDRGDVRRMAHNPEVEGSNPSPATKEAGQKALSE